MSVSMILRRLFTFASSIGHPAVSHVGNTLNHYTIAPDGRQWSVAAGVTVYPIARVYGDKSSARVYNKRHTGRILR
jgi:hypothetical protein